MIPEHSETETSLPRNSAIEAFQRFSSIHLSAAAELAIVFLIVSAAIAVVYRPLFSAFFQVDDFKWLQLSHWQSVAASFHGPWGHGAAYRPLSRLSFYLDYLAFGWRSGAWHAENLLMDAIAAVCIFAIALELKVNRFSALLAALLFAVSPMGSENIDWISGRTGLLCLIFMLLAVLCWIRGLRDWKWLVAAGVLYVLSMMTYEAGLVLPLVLICLAPAMLERNVSALRRQAAFLAVMFAVGAVFWWFRFQMIGMWGSDVDGAHGNIWGALHANPDRVKDQFLHTWGTVGVWIFACTGLVGLVSSKTRLLTIALLFMAGVFYLPFLMVNGVLPRFVFMMQAPICLIMVLSLVGDEGRPRFTLMLAMVGLLLAFGVSSYRQADNLCKASNVGRQILAEVVSIEAERPSNLVFDGVPNFAFGYPIMWFGFEDAVRARLNNSTLPVLTISPEVLSRPQVLHAALTQPTRYFVYSDRNGTMSELTRDAWVTLHSAEIHAAGQIP